MLTPTSVEGQAPSSDVTVRDNSVKYSFRIPAEWTEMDAETLANFNRASAKLGRGTHYERGCVLAGDGGLRSYILIQQMPKFVDQREIDQFAKELSGLDMKGPAAEVRRKAPGIQSFSTSPVAFDRSSGRFSMPLGVQTAQGSLRGISHGFVGASGFVFFHCYARGAEFDSLVPTFETIAASVGFDPGSTYADAMARAGGPWNKVIMGAIIGGAVGLGVPVLRRISKRKARSPAAGAPGQ